MDTLPPELLRYLIPFLPLTSLIAARGVSKKWRTLALTASLHPGRKALLDIYLDAIVHPNFPSLVDALQPLVRDFDREAYIVDLKSRGCVLPDVFELWILEWPSKAIHFWAWPGLKLLDADTNFVMHDFYYEGNMLCATSPTIDTIPLPKKDVTTVGSRTCQGLAMYEFYSMDPAVWCQLWVVVDPNERINDRLAGRLIWTITACSDIDRDGCVWEPKRIFHDIPFGPDDSDIDFKMVDFLDLLDVTCAQMDDHVDNFCLNGHPPMEE